MTGMKIKVDRSAIVFLAASKLLELFELTHEYPWLKDQVCEWLSELPEIIRSETGYCESGDGEKPLLS